MATRRARRTIDRRRRSCEHDVVVSATAGIRRTVCLRCGEVRLSTTGWEPTGVSIVPQNPTPDVRHRSI
jgi:hypothetical protein